MDFDKYLAEGSPLTTLLKHETLNLIFDDIFEKNQFPQDAIQGEMCHEAIMGFPSIMVEMIKRFGITPQEFGEIFAGYTQVLTAINVAICARSEGETAAINYVGQIKDSSERNYYKANISQLKESIVQDHTSASIFEYCSKFPPKSGYFYLLGIELARINYAVYGLNVMKFMNEKYGGIETMRIWMGMA